MESFFEAIESGKVMMIVYLKVSVKLIFFISIYVENIESVERLITDQVARTVDADGTSVLHWVAAENGKFKFILLVLIQFNYVQYICCKSVIIFL